MNGIDNDLYDSVTDPNRVLNFDIDSLARKAVNKRALPAVIRAVGQFIMMGTGDPYHENVFREVAAAYPDDCCARISFDAALAQRMYAGSISC